MQHIGPSYGKPTEEGTTHEIDLDLSPTLCVGKPIQRKITKEIEEKNKRAMDLVFPIHNKEVVMDKEHVDDTISTPGSQKNDETYKATKSSFPNYTCGDFKL